MTYTIVISIITNHQSLFIKHRYPKIVIPWVLVGPPLFSNATWCIGEASSKTSSFIEMLLILELTFFGNKYLGVVEVCVDIKRVIWFPEVLYTNGVHIRKSTIFNSN